MASDRATVEAEIVGKGRRARAMGEGERRLDAFRQAPPSYRERAPGVDRAVTLVRHGHTPDAV
jgi:hypothetical protein